MKTINIPTNKKDFKELWKKIKHPQRTKHNYNVLQKIAKEICYEVTSNYWKNDMSDYMRKEIPYKINEIIREHKNELR